MRNAGLVVAAALFSLSAHAWEDHALGAVVALGAMPEVAQAAPVEVEGFDAFLAREQGGLAAVLDQEESWAEAHVPHYAPRPAALRFSVGAAGESPARLRARFLRALRVNPTVRLALFVQVLPGHVMHVSGPTAPLGFPDVSILPAPVGYPVHPFSSVSEGERVAPLDVALTACDEPDYGLDIDLFTDSGTPWGREYGFGTLPFGNSAQVFSTQAPFHMGFFHEDKEIYLAASYLNRTYPEARIHAYVTLARYAFRTGHDYWGWRFAGWAAHYIEDLTQPYHATALPGVSDFKMLVTGLLDMVGDHGPKNEKIQLVTNRHLAFENYEFFTLREALNRGDPAAPALAALARTGGDAALGAFSDAFAREVVTVRSHAAAAHADAVIGAALPVRIGGDPTYVFGVTDRAVNVLELLRAGGNERTLGAMADLLSERMLEFGAATRAVVRAALTY